jgi:tetratricopeptide (TPR) repeat protein
MFEYSALELLRELTFSYIKGECPSLSFDDIYLLTDLFLRNEKYRSSRASLGRLHVLRADLYMHRKDFDKCMREYDAALDVDPNVEVLAVSAALLVDAGLSDEALRHIRSVRERLPDSYKVKYQWKKKIKPIEMLALNKTNALTGH